MAAFATGNPSKRVDVIRSSDAPGNQKFPLRHPLVATSLVTSVSLIMNFELDVVAGTLSDFGFDFKGDPLWIQATSSWTFDAGGPIVADLIDYGPNGKRFEGPKAWKTDLHLPVAESVREPIALRAVNSPFASW